MNNYNCSGYNSNNNNVIEDFGCSSCSNTNSGCSSWIWIIAIVLIFFFFCCNN